MIQNYQITQSYLSDLYVLNICLIVSKPDDCSRSNSCILLLCIT